MASALFIGPAVFSPGIEAFSAMMGRDIPGREGFTKINDNPVYCVGIFSLAAAFSSGSSKVARTAPRRWASSNQFFEGGNVL
jgi:hypothetical protein